MLGLEGGGGISLELGLELTGGGGFTMIQGR